LKYRWRLLAGFVFVSLSNYFRAWQPQVIREALDYVVTKVKLAAQSGGSLSTEQTGELTHALLRFGLTVLGLALLMGIFMFLMRQTIIVMSRLIEYDLRKEIFGHYERLDLAFYKRNNTGDLMARITEDVSKVRMYLGPAVLYGINLVSLFIMVIYSMFSVNVKLSLYSLAPLPILSISIYYVSNLINRKSEVIQQQLARLNSIAQEVYSGIRVVKSYVQELPMGRYFAGESEEFRTKSMSLARVDAMFFPLMVLLIGTSTIITVFAGGMLVAKGELTAGNIAEFVIYVNMLTWPVTSIGWVASLVQQASASQKRINEFLHTEPTIVHTVSKSRPVAGHIVFEEVNFVYPDTGIQALEHVSFELAPGQKLAIIGRTGSGKSTIADLLVRMYDVTSGRILLDGIDLREHDLANLRQKIGYVPQDVFLFSDTVTANIIFGAPEATLDDAEQYARYAAVYRDIADLPQQFDTVVGERGVTLSGGQKQRISIARALVKQPDIVILDDSLSAVDTNTEKQILEYLNTVLSDKTSIIITHRIYGLLDFDKIIVLDGGQIVESGTHEELLARRGYYHELFEKQKVETESIVGSQ
jgi:ATP-binding cassette subfamily B protein